MNGTTLNVDTIHQVVKQVESISMRVQKELILLHRENVAHPTGTVKWLNALGWLSSHFHVSPSLTLLMHSLLILSSHSRLLPPPHLYYSSYVLSSHSSSISLFLLSSLLLFLSFSSTHTIQIRCPDYFFSTPVSMPVSLQAAIIYFKSIDMYHLGRQGASSLHGQVSSGHPSLNK